LKTQSTKNRREITGENIKGWFTNFITFIFAIVILGVPISMVFIGFTVITSFIIKFISVLAPPLTDKITGIDWNGPIINALSAILVGSVASAIAWNTNKNRSKEAANTEFCNQMQWALDHMSNGENELQYRYATLIIDNYANNPPKYLLNEYQEIAKNLAVAYKKSRNHMATGQRQVSIRTKKYTPSER